MFFRFLYSLLLPCTLRLFLAAYSFIFIFAWTKAVTIPKCVCMCVTVCWHMFYSAIHMFGPNLIWPFGYICNMYCPLFKAWPLLKRDLSESAERILCFYRSNKKQLVVAKSDRYFTKLESTLKVFYFFFCFFIFILRIAWVINDSCQNLAIQIASWFAFCGIIDLA